MADKEQVQTGPTNPEAGSLADDFSEGPGIKLTGHPAMQAEEGGEPEGGAGAEEEAGKKAGEEEAGAKKPGEEEKPPEWKPKYKSQEEAEKAEKEAERKMHEATTKEAEERKAREAAERERDELLQKLAEKEKPPEKPAEETKPPSREEQKTRLMSVAKVANKKALEKINQLERPDKTDPDDVARYNDEVAAAWAEANTEALLEAGIGGVSQEAIDKLVKQRVEETLKAAQDAEKATREERRKKDEKIEAERIEAQAKELGKKAGLELDDPESVDSIVWDRIKGMIPDEVYAKNSLEAQVEWVVAEVRKRTGKVALTAAEREEAARKNQEENAVLGKGGTRTTKKPSKEDTGSLGGDFAEIRQQRTLT